MLLTLAIPPTPRGLCIFFLLLPVKLATPYHEENFTRDLPYPEKRNATQRNTTQCNTMKRNALKRDEMQ